MSRRVWIIIGIAVAVYAVVLVFDLTPLVRGPEEWRWERFAQPQWERAWPVAVALLFTGLWAWWIDRQRGRLRRLGVIGLVFAAAAIQLLAARTDQPDPIGVLYSRAVDNIANGYYTVGSQIQDVGDFLRRYPQLMPTFPIHPQVHPPGIPLIYYATGELFKTWSALSVSIGQAYRQLQCNDMTLARLSDAQLASASAGMYLPVIATALTGLAIYQLAKRRFGERAGFFAAALWAATPSVVLFAANWSQVYPFFACAVWWLIDAALARRRSWPFFIAGLILSWSTFMELGTAALALFIVLYILAQYVIDRRNPLRDGRFLLSGLLAGLVGVFTIWGIYQLVFGVSLKQIVDTMLPIHTGYEFNRLVWIFNHPYEFAEFLGLAVAGLLAVITVRSIRRARTGQTDALSLSLGVGLIVLSVVDPARDETARTWLLFMPLAIVVVSQVWAASTVKFRQFAVAWALLSVQVVVMVAVLQVIHGQLSGVPARETIAQVPASLIRTDVSFSDRLRLIGYTTDHAQPDRLTITYYWRALRQIERPYAVFNHVLNAENQRVAQRDSEPQDGRVLTTCWQPGEIYPDQHVIELPNDLTKADYSVRMGVYDGETGQRLTPMGDRVVGDTVEIGPIALP